MTGRLRRLLPSLSLALISIVVTLALLELVVRGLRLAPPAESPGWFWRVPDPQTGWALQPGASGRWFNPRNEYDVQVTINSQGLRDVERPGYEKPQGVFRILLLGDSYVEGLRVPLHQTFGKVLEAALNANAPPGTRFEVVSAGVSGWGTDQELLWFRGEGFKYQPDLVLLAFYPGNDFQNNSEALESANMGGVRKPFFRLEQGELSLQYHPFDPAQVPAAEDTGRSSADGPMSSEDELLPLATWQPWLQQHMALYRLIAPRLPELAPSLARQLARWGVISAGQELTEAGLGADHIPLAYGVYRQPPEPAWHEAFGLTKALIAQLQDEVQSRGAVLAAVVLPGPEQVYPQRWQQVLAQYPAMQQLEWDVGQANQVVAAVLEDSGVPYLDLLPVFREQAQAQRRPLHLRHDGHWTPAGEAVAGQAIHSFLVREKLVPAGSGE